MMEITLSDIVLTILFAVVYHIGFYYGQKKGKNEVRNHKFKQ